MISQKSKLAKAIHYALSRWEGLTRFIENGRIELDNNTVERYPPHGPHEVRRIVAAYSCHRSRSEFQCGRPVLQRRVRFHC
jgi:hypothetical protein